MDWEKHKCDYCSSVGYKKSFFYREKNARHYLMFCTSHVPIPRSNIVDIEITEEEFVAGRVLNE